MYITKNIRFMPKNIATAMVLGEGDPFAAEC
jgi:hypothetical protein